MEVFVKLLGLNNPLLEVELTFNNWAQAYLAAAEPFWIFLSDNFSTAQLLDVYIPMVGVLNNALMVRLICTLGVVNMVTSMVKWTSPEHRPYWWAREYPDRFNETAITQFPATCETSAGFPSSHTMSFTVFMYICTMYFFKVVCHVCHIDKRYYYRFAHSVFGVACICMWLSRLYLGTQFIHQCVVGSVFSLLIMKNMNKYSTFLYELKKSMAFGFALYIGILPAVVYIGMLAMNVDPHWSVRMAFKWCIDPMYLRHESSPIFVLCRDIGYLFGIALSAPIIKRIEKSSSFVRRLPLLLGIEFLNHYARLSTPKDIGRFIFVAYEAMRNLLHSFALLTLVSTMT